MKLDGNVPPGPLSEKGTHYRSTMNLVAPNNKRRIEVIVVGSGLAGASAAATLGELGYNVLNVDTVLLESSSYAVWRRPLTVIGARFAKITARLDF